MNDSIGLYLNEIGKVPLLTADEEKELSRVIEAGREAELRLEAGEKSAELRKAVAAAAHAKDRFIRANLRLVVSIARRYPLPAGMDLLDLVQEGNLGLQRAVDKYEWRRGFRFSTYAYWWIRQAVSRAVAEQSRTIRLPVHVVEQLTKLYNVARELERDLGRQPTPAEIGEQMGISGERCRDVPDRSPDWKLQSISRSPAKWARRAAAIPVCRADPHLRRACKESTVPPLRSLR